ncbi:MAG: homoserine dehydrogenase [Planctomycetota bacterium]
MEKSLGITLLGHGTVGRAVREIVTGRGELLARRVGRSVSVRHVVVRNPDAHDIPTTTDADAAITDDATDVVVELIGGTTTARELVGLALRHGKHVVTANKSLIAAHGPELFALAREHGVSIGFEASCAGGIPIVHALTAGLLANDHHALVGILNGTCNFILTKMTTEGTDYDAALSEAQAAGFAEADPTLDVTGRDAAQKLAILASLAFDSAVSEKHVHCEGIAGLDAADIGFASELGYVVKLLAVAEREAGQLALRVAPHLVHERDVLAGVSGPFNAVSVWGDALGHSLHYGRGAGGSATASAVVADILGIALGTVPAAFAKLAAFAENPGADHRPIDQLRGRYYVRCHARDEPGVMSKVAAALGAEGISLAGVMQHEAPGATVPIVVTTHEAEESAVDRAIVKIDALDAVAGPPVKLRILDMPEEKL